MPTTKRSVGELFSIQKGKKVLESSEPTAIRYIQIEDLRGDGNLKWIVPDQPFVDCDEEDILLAWDGANAGEFGYGLKGALGSTLAKLSPLNGSIHTPYVGYFLKSRSPYLRSRCTGATIPHVNRRVLEEMEVPLPPLPEQRRIAAILDKAQALIDNDRRTLALYDQLARSVFLEMFGDPVLNERGWKLVELGDVIVAIENGWSPNCESYPRNSSDEWAVLKLGSVTYRQFNANENKVLPGIESARPELEVQAGDLLVTRKNTKELVGAAAYVFETAPRLMIPDLIFRIHTREKKVEKLFLWMLFNEDRFRKNLQQLASGSASSMPNISKAKLKALPIPLPPLKVQQRFAVAALLLRDRRACIETSLQESESLFGGLLQIAFSGRAFDGNPNQAIQ